MTTTTLNTEPFQFVAAPLGPEWEGTEDAILVEVERSCLRLPCHLRGHWPRPIARRAKTVSPRQADRLLKSIDPRRRGRWSASRGSRAIRIRFVHSRTRTPRNAFKAIKGSVGRNNMFGHPAQSTIETPRTLEAAVCRTDDNGAVTVPSDGSNIRVKSS